MESVNKYFDVIVEEEEDDDEGCNNRSSMAAPNSDLESSEYETDYSENESVFYPDSDEERDSEVSKPVFKSTSNIRGMLSQVMNKVSSNVGASKEVLVQRIKTNLKGSQISLCD